MKLLLAEDERDLANAIKRILENSHYEVDVAYDGHEALNLIQKYHYDALILDIMMPRIDGITLVKTIRSSNNNVPILLLTARAEIDDKVLGLDAGADDYLTKPFVIKELLARVRALLRRNNNECGILTLGNFSLDSKTYELKAESSIRLTNKEFKLMEYLMQNKSLYSSSEKLLESVWDFDTDSEINVVWVYISELRKKLEKIKANYTIKVARGVGYRLEEIK